MTMEHPKLLFLVTEDWYFATHRLSLARRAAREGFRVSIATRISEHGPALLETGAELIPLTWRRSGNGPLSHAAALAQIAGIYRDVQPDIVHHVALKPVVFGSLATWSTASRPGIVNAIAGLGDAFTNQGLRVGAARSALSLALRALLDGSRTRVILQNPEDRDVLVGAGLVAPERAVLIRGAGVSLTEFRPVPRARAGCLVILPSRLLWAKGVGEFVEAARRLKVRNVNARFALVGDTDLDSPNPVPREQLDAWRAEGVVETWGRRSDMPNVLAAADVVCLPSCYGEGIPKALLEAAAAGLPIITTDTPGCREVVRDGWNGLLVPPRDVGALEAAILRLIEAPDRRRAMGERGRALAEAEFSDESVASATLALYRELLA